MNYTCKWHDEAKTILILGTPGDWTWEDARTIVQRQYDEMATVNHKVQTIYIVNGQLKRGPGSAILQLKSLMDITHPNEDMVVFVGNHYLLATLINLVDRIYRMTSLTSKYRYVSTFEEALSVITDHQAREEAA